MSVARTHTAERHPAAASGSDPAAGPDAATDADLATGPAPASALAAATAGSSAPEEDPLIALGESFKAAMGAVRRLRGRETQHPGRLSYAQYSLLLGLATQPRLSASKLAGLADLSPATVTEMLDHLESDGLVTRARFERDRRVVLVSLTRRGRTLVQSRRAQLERRWREALADFDDRQLVHAAAVLDRLGQLFDELATDD